MQQKLGMQILYDSLPKNLDRLLHILMYHHCWELMKSVGSHGSSSVLFMMKVMVLHFVSSYDLQSLSCLVQIMVVKTPL
jgi:hypothetical protein